MDSLSSLRRIVTTLGADGKSHIARVDELKERPGGPRTIPADVIAKNYPNGSPDMRVIWDHGTLPVELPSDPDWQPSGQHPTAQGTRISVIGYPPGWQGEMFWSSRVDILIIMSGALTYVTDSGDEITAVPGDYIIQNGTNKSFRNKGDVPAVFTAVMFSALQTGPTPPMEQFHGKPADLYFKEP